VSHVSQSTLENNSRGTLCRFCAGAGSSWLQLSTYENGKTPNNESTLCNGM
jgi:hypothetical protein